MGWLRTGALGALVFVLLALFLFPIKVNEDVKRAPIIFVSKPSSISQLPTLPEAPSEPVEASVTDAEPENEEPSMLYFGTLQMTAYVATGNACADGSMPCVGWTVASNDPRLWHKTIYISGYGIRYVHDTGGMAVNVLDLFVGSLGEAYQIGRRNVEVYIIE